MHNALLLALTVVAYAPEALAFDFKGVRVGAKSTVAEVQERLGISCGVGYADKQVCNGHVTVADEPATINLLLAPSGLVQRISLQLSSEPFEQVAAALVQKLGPPTHVSQGTLQNRFGAKFRQIEYVWIGKGGIRVDYRKYGSSLDHSQLYYSTREDRELQSGDKPAKRAKDL